MVVAAAMLLLPLLYLGLIVLAGTGVWWHLTRNVWLVQGGAGGGYAAQWRVVAYAAPALAGAVVTLFMVKPVFARRERPREPLVLAPDDQPQLFAFIEQICRHVRAPVPRVVQVDCQVNASASFAPHWSSMFRRDLVLTIWSDSEDGRLKLLVLPSLAGVWLSRQLLRGLMTGGHVISCFMMRQMEYDADSYEVKIAGAEAFGKTMKHLRELNLAQFHSAGYMQSELSSRRLPADLPLFLVTWHKARSADAFTVEEAPDLKSSLFDTHPTDGERIAAAQRAADRGILFGGHDSAVRLFRDFDALSRLATRHHYDVGGVLDEVTLVDTLDSVQASLGREERQRALFTIYNFGVSRFRPQRLPEPDAAASPAPEVQTWRFPDALERYDDRMNQRTKSFVAHELIHAGYRGVDPAEFGLSEWTVDATMASEKEATEKIGVLAQLIEPYERVCAARVAHGLERLAHSGDARYSNANVRALVRALDTTADALEAGFDLWRIRAADAALAHMAAASRGPDPTRARRERLMRIGHSHLARMRETLAGVPCPVLLDPETATLEAACRLAAIDDASEALVAVETLHGRLMLEVCWLALKGEAG